MATKQTVPADIKSIKLGGLLDTQVIWTGQGEWNCVTVVTEAGTEKVFKFAWYEEARDFVTACRDAIRKSGNKLEVFEIVRKSVTTFKGRAKIQAGSLDEALELAEELDDEMWIDETESDGGYTYTEDATLFYVAYAGEYCRIHANNRQSALWQAQQDYNRPPAKRLLDWKDSEHTAEEWDITKL